MNKTIGRRGFLKASACVGAALTAGALLGGCSAQTPMNGTGGQPTDGSAKEPEFSKEESCDVIVCGAGTAGTFAAIRAADLGAKVVCLEKKGAFGGTSQFTEGFACVNSTATREAGAEFDEQEAFMKIMEYEDWGSLTAPLRAYVSMSGEAVDWAASKGVEVTPTNPIMMSDVITYVNGTTVNGEYALNGEGLIAPLWKFGKTTGNVDIRYDMPMTGLVVEDGAVRGVYAKGSDGETIKISASAVILATGGFCYNEEMFERYMNYPYERIIFYGMDGRDGDGIRMARDMGAALHAPAAAMYTYGGVAGTTIMNDVLNAAIAWEVNVTVNEEGKRFYNEGLAYTDPTTRNIALLNQQSAWAITDDEYIQSKVALGDIDYGSGKSTGDLMKSLASNPDCVKADSLADLAELMDVNAANLAESVKTFNSCVDNCIDPEFGVMPPFLTNKVEKAPFYAVRLKASAYTTLGGLATDGSMRVLDDDMKPVEGLYACGTDNGSLYYRDYPMSVFGGLGQGWCLTSGYIAANVACGK